MRPELDETQPAPPAPVTPDRTATQPASGPPPAPGDGLAAGQQLGHFRIERPLGAGGMGEVYLATDLALDRPVAIKVLPKAVAQEPRRRERMIREARAQARITHPNVGHIYFVGEDGDRLYFAMEYVAGQTLAERIAQGPMSIDDALVVIRDAALGLREAQRSGITHRDVKPSNLMLDAHGLVKVLDFGLAAGGSDGAVTGPVAQTSLAGTPLYMAPEQARGEAVDFRSDIYALGATLYHLVSGKPPFQADSVDELLSMHATAARPNVPRQGQRRSQIGQLESLVSKMMAARPEDRFASYDELLNALELASVMHTRPGGLWARGLAMLIDFMVVGFVAVVVSMVLQLAVDDLNVDNRILIPTLAVFHVVGVARWGTTIGKAVMELEVVDVHTGMRPSWPAAIRRGLVLFGIPLLGLGTRVVLQVAGITSARDLPSIFDTLWVVLGVGLLVLASVGSFAKRTVWDRIAGTVVRYRTKRPAFRRA